jgi:hypothetical protein
LRIDGDDLEMSLFPNPSDGVLIISLTSPMNMTYTVVVEVFNLLGQQIYRWDGASSGSLNQTIDLKTQAAGQYFVKTTIGENELTDIIILTR